MNISLPIPVVTPAEPGQISSSRVFSSGNAASIKTERVVIETQSHRADIDGLRALAVLSVIGFHAAGHWVPGGFVGVDVFFVISGFLISGILVKALENGQFSFRSFYARRIRRIFPALIVMLFAIWILGWPVLMASEYKQFGQGHYFWSLFRFQYFVLAAIRILCRRGRDQAPPSPVVSGGRGAILSFVALGALPVVEAGI